MIPVASLAGKRVALFGLGGSGVATARALIAGGAEITAFDDNARSVASAAEAGISTGDLRALDWRGIAALVLAPGVPLTHPTPHWSVKLAQAAGVEIIGDVELFCRERRRTAPKAPFVAITGTNGKSTTTALIAHILAAAGRDVQLGGNFGPPILGLEPPGTGRVHVIECSSFQIDLAPSLDPGVGVMLNLSPDHLDRHGTMADYAAIKERLVAASDVAVVGVDDNLSAAMADRYERAGRGRLVRISAHKPLSRGLYAEGPRLIEANDGSSRMVAVIDGISTLRGRHNAQNAAAAVAAAKALGVEEAAIVAALKTFPGLHHRMEEVGRLGHVLFINDSKATNADATSMALASFQRIYWIAGGTSKEGGIATLDSFFPRIAKVYLIGKSAEEFGRTVAGKLPVAMSGTLEEAVKAAAADASKDTHFEPVVLLSPAAASYDQFRNFEHRGDSFRTLVQAIEGVRSTGRIA
jgi:UDP-N-acetylmuramoylalanine--D-glutamate ligase